jgi:multiple antibiotic resistance protein
MSLRRFAGEDWCAPAKKGLYDRQPTLGSLSSSVPKKFMKIHSIATCVPSYLRRNIRLTSLARIAVILAIALAHSLDARASDSFRSSISSGRLDLAEALTFFFLMLGPIQVLAPFVTMTEGVESSFRTQLAIRATIFSCLALAATVPIGERSVENYGVSLNVLALTGGLVLSVVAFQTILEQFQTDQKAEAETLPLNVAVLRLAFPIIITPYSIAAIIIFTAIASDTSTKIAVTALALGVLLLDLVAMLVACPVLKWLGAPLLIMGVVLAIIQLSLGVQIVLNNLAALGVFALRSS